ncbi:hypothetical protein [Mycolicibacterium moriokaense]|uniref:FUSC family protein n=1 Tax=Mycolicibacterium moriokaense TaxID=39691 RepID=A0A318HHY5_9MYCO|nr:hypothetical protein [Mycolicibacterium moriokaense]PXX09112.1 hypothetical protein C8E89_10638 [Mycolicibacterium moriokaense]
MTGPEDSHSSTRPISVAELLAKNGTIGAPPVGGRRRRRRGDTDSVTVAELTGEIPIVRDHDVQEAETTRTIPAVVTEPVAASTNGVVAHDDEVESAGKADSDADSQDDVFDYEDVGDVDDEYADAVAEYTAHIEDREVDADPLDFFSPPPRRPQNTPDPRGFRTSVSRGAEQMSPDPVDDDEDLAVVEPPEIEDEDAEAAVGEVGKKDIDEPPSYLRSTAGPLFGGQTVADDLARRGAPPRPEDIDLRDEEDAAPAPMSSFLRAAWVVGQCIIAVAFGAGLFIAFDQLWKWNNIVALVLSVLVILGLVVGVRVVRKTEDIGSTLIAVAVGALVTLGPLALLQSG